MVLIKWQFIQRLFHGIFKLKLQSIEIKNKNKINILHRTQ